MEKEKSSKIKEVLSQLTSNRQESLFQSFLIGTAYMRYKMDDKVLSAFTQSLEQLVMLSQSMQRDDIIQELYTSLLSGKEQAPIIYIDSLTDKLFLSDEQAIIKSNSNKDSDELYRKMLEDEQKEEIERQQKDEFLARQTAKKMEEEDKQNIKILKEMQNAENENWNCEICLEQMTDSQFMPLECRHQFHTNCLSQYLNVKIKDRNFPLKCPNESCKREIEYADLKDILTKQEFQKYEEFQLNSYIDNNLDEISWCPSAGCKYAFVLEENQVQLICPLCRKRYCLTCKCEFHKNQTCKEYQISHTHSESDKRFEQFVRGQKFKQCLSCKMWVERNQGCDHMTCRCGCQFCYKCGGPYQKCDCVARR